jgi:hypothetical protein
MMQAQDAKNVPHEASTRLEKASENTKAMRPSHLSLPRLKIPRNQGPKPIEIPQDMAESFLTMVMAYQKAWGVILPLPVVRAESYSDCDEDDNSSPSEEEHIDPYYEEIPTPPTLQFTANEARELEQWKETVGELRTAHCEAFEELARHPRDRELRNKVQELRKERQMKVAKISQIHERRRIRRDFRKDFNNHALGW